jgi:chaperonin GroES
MRFIPSNDLILVLPSKTKDVSDGGIILPETALQKPGEGVVVEVGPNLNKDLIGKVVVFSKYNGTGLLLGEVSYQILSTSDVLGIIEE